MKYPHLWETNVIGYTKPVYKIEDGYTFKDLTDEEKEIVYQSEVDVNKFYNNEYRKNLEQARIEINKLKQGKTE